MARKKLKVARSGLPNAGLGLFACADFKRGERITEYKGKIRLWKEAKQEDGINGYLLRLNNRLVIDARPLRSGFGRFANDAAGLSRAKGMRNNSQYLIYGRKCFIEATRAIARGEEILVPYGRAFWNLQRRLQTKPNSR